MSVLTATLSQSCTNPVVGLCHSYFEFKDVLQHIFGLNSWNEISLSIAGMNHFTWLIDFKIGKADGYTMLREKIGSGSLRKLLPRESVDDKGYTSKHNLCVNLYDAYGYLPYPGDRHICEFVSYTLSGNPERHTIVDSDGETYDTIQYCNIKRTSIAQRRQKFVKRKEEIREWIHRFSQKEVSVSIEKSRETGAEILYAYLNNKSITEVVNTTNRGQIPGLPLGACVETFGMIDGLGVRPVVVDHVPEHLLEVMRPQAINEKWITKGAINRDKSLLLQALYNDPQCSYLKPDEIKSMADELFVANQKYISI